jgi:hypothetical protein
MEIDISDVNITMLQAILPSALELSIPALEFLLVDVYPPSDDHVCGAVRGTYNDVDPPMHSKSRYSLLHSSDEAKVSFDVIASKSVVRL